MPAEPLRKTQEAFDVVYVLPPWAVRKPKRGGLVGILRSDTVRAILVVVQPLAIVAVLGWCFYVLAPDLYRLKCKAGIDLVPGIHGSDVFPFLDGK